MISCSLKWPVKTPKTLIFINNMPIMKWLELYVEVYLLFNFHYIEGYQLVYRKQPCLKGNSCKQQFTRTGVSFYCDPLEFLLRNTPIRRVNVNNLPRTRCVPPQAGWITICTWHPDWISLIIGNVMTSSGPGPLVSCDTFAFLWKDSSL